MWLGPAVAAPCPLTPGFSPWTTCPEGQDSTQTCPGQGRLFPVCSLLLSCPGTGQQQGKGWGGFGLAFWDPTAGCAIEFSFQQPGDALSSSLCLWSRPRSKIPCREGVAGALKDKPGRTEHSLVLFSISLPLASIPCPYFPFPALVFHPWPCFPALALLSIPQLGILWMSCIPSWLPEGCLNPRISWNLSPSPCLVPQLCFPGLQRREQPGRAGQERREDSFRLPSCIHPHPEHLDLCSWQSSPVIPANQRLSRGKRGA